MNSMVTPTVSENARAHVRAERDDFGDDSPARAPRSEPYNRPRSQREWVRMSLDFDTRQHDVYRNRRI